MLVPDFGPTMNVIAYSPFQDGESAQAAGGSASAVASDAAHKPTRLFRRSGAIGFSSKSNLGCVPHLVQQVAVGTRRSAAGDPPAGNRWLRPSSALGKHCASAALSVRTGR